MNSEICLPRETLEKEVDYLKPAAGYLVLDTKCTGICGSDYPIIRLVSAYIDEDQRVIIGTA